MKPYDLIIKHPFPGYPQTIVDKETHKVYHTDLTLEEYLTANPDTKVVTVDEYMTIHTEHHVTKFEETSEEIWISALECLPPLKWHKIPGASIEIFFQSEAYSGSIHSLYLHDYNKGKYFYCKVDVRTKDVDIVKKYEAEIKPY